MKARNKAFGERLKTLRSRFQLTQLIASNELKISVRALQDHEAGRIPNQNILQNYLDYYGCDQEWLMTGQGEPFPKTEGVAEERGEYTLTRRPQPDHGMPSQLGGTPAAQDQPVSDPFIHAISSLTDIMNSNNQSIIKAFTVNLAAFQSMVDDRRVIESRLSSIEEKFDDINKKLNELVRQLNSGRKNGI